ncbi:MAG: hypothetical protein FWC62_03080 [Firmicutes bacterium]|nr:hypothetical protein [Bacillota bacterium]
MEDDKPMRLILIEDDIAACRVFTDRAGGRTDVAFVGVTGRSDEGLEYVKDKLPEAVILDLELNWGSGSGLDFLEALQKTELSVRPIVVVTTRNRSELMQEHLYSYGVEWVFCKKQAGYSPEMVLNHLVKLRPYLSARQVGLSPELRTLETPEELRIRITQRIDAELNAIGISPRFKGRELLQEAILLLIGKEKKEFDTVFYDLSVKHKTHYNNIVRNIQAAIQSAWQNNDLDTLELLYTAPVRRDIGAPTPTEFTHYYANKIRRSI